MYALKPDNHIRNNVMNVRIKLNLFIYIYTVKLELKNNQIMLYLRVMKYVAYWTASNILPYSRRIINKSSNSCRTTNPVGGNNHWATYGRYKISIYSKKRIIVCTLVRAHHRCSVINIPCNDFRAQQNIQPIRFPFLNNFANDVIQIHT